MSDARSLFWKIYPSADKAHWGTLASLVALGVIEDASAGLGGDDRGNLLFSSLICGRSVLLVGAAPVVPADYISEDSYDVVIRVTPAINTDSSRAETCPLGRCDIAYLTNVTRDGVASLTRTFGDRRLGLIGMQPPLLVVLRKVPDVAFVGGTPTRSIPNLRGVAIGSPTAGTQAVIDVLLQRPRSLDLVGFNFYTSPSPYRAEVLEQKRRNFRLVSAGRDFRWLGYHVDPTIHAVQWASHDLASDFQFMKTLVNVNMKVRALGQAADVLRWSLDDYFYRFDALQSGRA